MDRGPRMLAAFVQGTLDSIDGADAELGRRVRARMRPDLLQTLESASRIGFVPLDLDVEITRCLFAEAGPERARHIFRRNMAATFEAPVLRSFMGMAVRLRGGDPARLLDWCSKVWSQIYRDAGSIEFWALGDAAGRFELRGLPEVLAGEPAYLDGLAASISAIFDLLEVPGAVELQAVDASSGRAILSAAWEPRS